MGQEGTGRYHWAVLQTGELPLRPDRSVREEVEHRCTSILVWAEGEPPSPSSTVLVDPCFTLPGITEAAGHLATLGVSLAEVGYLFVTHPHGDHLPRLPSKALGNFTWRPPSRRGDALAGLRVVHCPGHDSLLRALAFVAVDGQAVWVVGDAILDAEWLRAWGYYWPNGYTPPEVIETWRSVARILAGADVIVPGHGPPLAVTASLVKELLASFPQADYAGACPEVGRALRARLDALACG